MNSFEKAVRVSQKLFARGKLSLQDAIMDATVTMPHDDFVVFARFAQYSINNMGLPHERASFDFIKPNTKEAELFFTLMMKYAKLQVFR